MAVGEMSMFLFERMSVDMKQEKRFMMQNFFVRPFPVIAQVVSVCCTKFGSLAECI